MNNNYFFYSDKLRANIIRYACQHGDQAASCFFSRKLDTKISRSSVHSMKKDYLKRSRVNTIQKIWLLFHPRPLLIGDLDQQVQLDLTKIREQGGVIIASVVVAADILMARKCSQLDQFGGHIILTRHWAYHLLGQMKFVR